MTDKHTPEAHLVLALNPIEAGPERAECGCALNRKKDGWVFHRFCPVHHAAPELLEALKRVARDADESLMQHPDDLPAILAVTYKQVRDAIKATRGDA